MKISYAITVCNEFIEIQRLLNFLFEHKRPQDEIIVQMDLNLDDLKDCPPIKREVFGYIMKHNEQGNIRVVFCPLNNDFAAFKNHLTKECKGDYIFFLDADEIPNENLIQFLPDMLDGNGEVEVFLVPRINTVDNIGLSHIQKWRWNVSRLEGFIGEKELDLSNPRDMDEYNLLKQYNLIIEESIFSK